MIGDAHPFKCGECAKPTAHILVRTYECEDIPEAPGEVWLIECQRCFTQRIIYPAERLAAREDDITRCDQCGNYKMKADKCRICRLAADEEKIKIKYFTGHKEITKEISIADL